MSSLMVENGGNTTTQSQQESKMDTELISIKDESIHFRLKKILSNKQFLLLLPFIFLWVTSYALPTVFLPGYAARWFSNCTKEMDDLNECKYDYNRYNRFSGYFLAFAGIISFLFGGFMGKLSDIYGRKIFLILNVILSDLQFVVMIFYKNLFIRLYLMILTGFACSDNSLSPTMISYVSDIFSYKYRTFAYGITYGICAFGLIFGIGLELLIENVWSVEANFYAIGIIYILQIIYVSVFVKESLTKDKRGTFDKNCQTYNPFGPLFVMFKHPIILYVAIIQFFIAIPETGVIEMSMNYILDQMDVNDQYNSDVITAIFISSMSVGLLIGNLYLLPKLQNKFNNINILVIGIIMMIIGFIFMMILSWISHILFVILSGIFIMMSMIAFPASNGIATKYLNIEEQGIGFGIIYSIRALGWIIAPIIFSVFYDYFKNNGLPGFSVLILAIMCCIALIIALIPLRKSIDNAIKNGIKYRYNNDIQYESVSNIESSDVSNDEQNVAL